MNATPVLAGLAVSQNPTACQALPVRVYPHRAAEWRFHPGQEARRLPDGSLEVRFRASGWLEMAWHLYQWGESVEVIAPKDLADLVHPARRGDFDALP